jgi:plastocyanin
VKYLKATLSVAAIIAAVSVRAAAPITVTQHGLQFSSADLAVSKGQMVVFMNDDKTPHNITVNGDGVNLNSGLQPPGVEFKVPFGKPGTYTVSCGIHPKMKMTVTVK